MQKASILISKGDTRVNEYTVPYYFDNEYEFTNEDGFNVAFSFTNLLWPATFDSSFGHFEVYLH